MRLRALACIAQIRWGSSRLRAEFTRLPSEVKAYSRDTAIVFSDHRRETSMNMKIYCTLAFAALVIVSTPGLARAASLPAANTSTDPDAYKLLAVHAAYMPRLAHNQFGRPLVLQSLETSRRVSGDIYAEIDTPFETVRKSFANPRNWCEVLILHINTKYCHAGIGADSNRLSVRVGKKGAQDINQAFALEFAFRLKANRADYMAALLTAPAGPLGTADYQFELQVIPLTSAKSFLRLHYSYAFGGVARLATQGYLATAGRDKVGFTRDPIGAGKYAYVTGMRSVVERNTMRYYLAVESYLASLLLPPGRQFNDRIERWFDATEQYRLQLHEMDRTEYLSMKKSEYARQQVAIGR